MTIMRSLFVGLLLFLLAGCGEMGSEEDLNLTSFLEVLKGQGVSGDLLIHGPINDDMVYVAEYAISKYTSTRIISIFKCKNEEGCERNLQDSLKNDKLSGQARNGRYMMVATFYPAEEEAVAKIKKLFLDHKFE